MTSLPLLVPVPANPKRQACGPMGHMRPTVRGLCRITGVSNLVEGHFMKYIEGLTDEEKKTCWEEIMKYYWDDDDAKVVELILGHVASMETKNEPDGGASGSRRITRTGGKK